MELRVDFFIDASNLPEVRCQRCKKLLFCGKVKQIEIKCPRCNLLQNISEEPQENELRQSPKQ